MPPPENSYLAKIRLTSDVSNALHYLLQDLSIRDPEVREPSDMLDTSHGIVVLDAFLKYNPSYQREEVIPFVPPGFPASYPIISNIDAAKHIRTALVSLRSDLTNDRFEIDTSAGFEGFKRSVDAYFAVQFGALPPTDMVASAMTMLPHTLDWHNRADAGAFADYLKLRRSFVTFHTQQQIYIQQLNAAIQELKAIDIHSIFAVEIRYVQARLEKVVADLQGYFFEHGSFSRLHTESLQNSLFHESRDYGSYAGRLVLNVSQANDIDHTGEFGSLLLKAVDNWFKKQGGIVRSAVQSAEKTSFQFILEKPEDLETLFTNHFSEDIRRELRLEFERRYKDPATIDGKAMMLLRCVETFNVRGDAVVLPINSGNILDLAIQDESDIDAFGEVLLESGSLERISGEISNMLVLGGEERKAAAKDLFGKLKPFLENRSVDMRGLKNWVKDTSEGVEESERRKKVLQAFVLQGVYYHLKRVSGVLDYFEQEKASVGPIGVYYASDIPTQSDSVEYEKFLSYLARDKYVSDGAYNPGIEKEFLLDSELMAHLPHLRVILQQEEEENLTNLHPKIARILKIWERSQKIWGRLDHERNESEGGTKQVLFRAIENAVKTAEGDDFETKQRALEELQIASQNFTDEMAHMWGRAIADPKNPYLIKRDVKGTTSNRTMVNVDVFKQELARLGWMDVMGVEADSMQAYLRAHSMEFSPDFNDAPFQSAWDVILEVANDWRMPYPLIYRPAGDFVMVVIPPKDVNGVSVDTESFTHEVWSRVAEKYADKPFHDMKKVTMTKSVVTLDGNYDSGYLHSTLVKIADDLNLQTVPFMLPEKNNTFILYRADGNDWNDDKVRTDEILRSFVDQGVAIKGYELDIQGAFERLGIYYQGEGEGRRYRYAKFSPDESWRRFMKTLTFTTVTGKAGRVINNITARIFDQMQDEMANDAERAKDANAPYKMGYAVHRSALITDDNLNDRLHVQWKRMSELACHIAKGLGEIEEYISTAFKRRDPQSVYATLVTLYNKASERLGWLHALEMSQNRFKAENASFAKAIERTSVSMSREAVEKSDAIKSGSNVAVDILENMINSFRVIKTLAGKENVLFTQANMDEGLKAIALIAAKISEFRKLEIFSKVNLEGGGGAGGHGTDNMPPAASGQDVTPGETASAGAAVSASDDETRFENTFLTETLVITQPLVYSASTATNGQSHAYYHNVPIYSGVNTYPAPTNSVTSFRPQNLAITSSSMRFMGQNTGWLPVAPVQIFQSSVGIMAPIPAVR